MTEPLLPRTRRAAVHWLRPTRIDTPMFGPMDTHTVACGTAIDRDDWTDRATTQVARVTCKECYALAQANAGQGGAP